MAMYNLLVETFVEIFLKAINSVVHLYERQHIGTYIYMQTMYLFTNQNGRIYAEEEKWNQVQMTIYLIYQWIMRSSHEL